MLQNYTPYAVGKVLFMLSDAVRFTFLLFFDRSVIILASAHALLDLHHLPVNLVSSLFAYRLYYYIYINTIAELFFNTKSVVLFKKTEIMT